MEIGDQLPDGTLIKEGTKCPCVSEDFGQLPDVKQWQKTWVGSKSNETVGYDCYIMARAKIRAGTTNGMSCNVSSSSDESESYATCLSPAEIEAPDEDWLTDLAPDSTSEVLKYTVLQNYSGPWINRNLTEYTTGMLTLGYHAAWSGLTKHLGNLSNIEEIQYRPAKAVIFDRVARGNLYVWLALNVTLTLSALLVFLAQCFSNTKTIHDSMLGALTIDLGEITCTDRAPGLCNAFALARGDEELPRLEWKDNGRESEVREDGIGQCCRRRVAFINDNKSVSRRDVIRTKNAYENYS